MRNRRRRWATLATPLVACLAFACRRSPTPEQTPAGTQPTARNVVVVLADTLRASNLGVYGYRRDTSPEMAALAAEGYLFEDVRSQAPCTYPSANSILTGRDGTAFWIQEDQRIGIPESTPSLAEILSDRGWTTVAVSASPIVRRSPSEHNRYGGFGRGFDLFDEGCLWKDARCVNQRALGYLEAVRQPFFLYLHYMDPHDPFRPPERHFSSAEYEGKAFIGRGDPNPILRLVYGDDPPGFEITDDDLAYLEASYDDEIAFFDAALGRLVGALREHRLLDDTLVAVIADHGEEFLEHGHIKHCHAVYDTEIHTPMVLRIPGLPGNRRIGELAQNLDLVPTILDYLGVETPDVRLDGRSLRTLIEEGTPAHRTVFAAYGSLRAVTTEQYKLIMDLGTKQVELYDRSTDPDEKRDVSSEHPDVVRGLQRELSAWIRGTEGMGSEKEALQRGQEAAERLRSLGYVR